jgi:hypothetical protein
MSGKKRLTIVCCIVLSLAVFGVSAAAAAYHQSGYERLKSALFSLYDTLNEDSNGTVEAAFSLSRDGSELLFAEMTRQQGGRNFAYSREATRVSLSNLGGRAAEEGAFSDESSTDEFYQDGDVIIRGENGLYYEYPNYGALSSGSGYGKEPLSEAQRRFIEVLGDTLVGDLKNYFVTDGDKVSISLSGYQIPELAQLALQILTEAYNDQMPDDPDLSEILAGYRLGTDARFASCSLDAALDESGGLSEITLQAVAAISGTLDGETSDFELRMTLAASELGTTIPTRLAATVPAGPDPAYD